MFAFFYNCIVFICISLVLSNSLPLPLPHYGMLYKQHHLCFPPVNSNLRVIQIIRFAICYVNKTNSSKSNKSWLQQDYVLISSISTLLYSHSRLKLKSKSMYPSDKPGHSTHSTDCRVNSSCGWSCNPAAWTGPCLPIAQSPSSDSAFVSKQRSLCSEALRGVPLPSCPSCVTLRSTRTLYYIMQEGCLITVLVWI